MKRSMSILAAMLWAVSVLAEGIGTPKDLLEFIKAYNAGADVSMWMSADSTFRLTADIDLAKEKKIPQIANWGGKFSGEGFRIKNYKATEPLIGCVLENGVVEKVVIDESCSMKVTSKSTEYVTAFLVGENFGIVRDCENYGSISHKCTYTSNPIYIGGLVGSNNYCVLRCANHGNISSDCSNAEQKADLAVSVGGVVGGMKGKMSPAATICWCTNDGTVSLRSDFPAENIGGVVGGAGGVTVKYCINRGEVKSASFLSEAEKPAAAQTRTGGVVGFTKADVACCDNYGKVHTSGTASSYSGGVVGQPHAALCVTDCVNYGRIFVENEAPSFIGGIVGNIGRPVHIRRCINRGTVDFEGVSARKRSCVGGIVGQIYCPKTTKEGTYVRNCANYGEVRSGHAGNNNSGNDDAIHTGGIAGYMASREGFHSFLYDCTNAGTVTAAGGRKGNICAATVQVKTGGSLPDDDCILCEPAADGTNVSGRVTDTEGKGLEGVVVSDGRQCVLTDAEGRYAMKSNLDEAHFVYVSIPADAEALTYGGVPRFFRRIPRHATAVKGDFILRSRPKADKYTLMMLGDPQVRPFGVDNSMERWWDTIAPDVEKFRSEQKTDVYCINLGDLVYNFMYAYDDYLDAASQIKCPTFNVMGNHDFDQNTLFDTTLGTMYFESYISPEHYSFNIGNVHFMVLNTILYDRKKATDKYHYGLDERAIEWLEADLASVPKDKIIVTCSHAQMFKKKGTTPNGSHSAYNLNYKRYLEVLRQYRKVYSWAGHYHSNYQYSYQGQNTEWGAPNIESIVVTRCTGALRFNDYIGDHGEPQGYMVVDVDGDNLSWWYKGVGTGKDYQMKLYDPNRLGDGYVRANIFNWAESWSAVEWWENGAKAGEMEFHEETDPDYCDRYEQITSKKTKRYCKPGKDCYMFRIKPSEGVRAGEVHVKDQFGNEFTAKIEW